MSIVVTAGTKAITARTQRVFVVGAASSTMSLDAGTTTIPIGLNVLELPGDELQGKTITIAGTASVIEIVRDSA